MKTSTLILGAVIGIVLVKLLLNEGQRRGLVTLAKPGRVNYGPGLNTDYEYWA